MGGSGGACPPSYSLIGVTFQGWASIELELDIYIINGHTLGNMGLWAESGASPEKTDVSGNFMKILPENTNI